MSLDVPWCPLMSLDVSWCLLMSINVYWSFVTMSGIISPVDPHLQLGVDGRSHPTTRRCSSDGVWALNARSMGIRQIWMSHMQSAWINNIYIYISSIEYIYIDTHEYIQYTYIYIWIYTIWIHTHIIVFFLVSATKGIVHFVGRGTAHRNAPLFYLNLGLKSVEVEQK